MSDINANLWHYTNFEGLIGIIESQRLWATDYRCLNDSSELMYSKTLLRKGLLPLIQKDLEKESGGMERYAEKSTESAVDLLVDSLFHCDSWHPAFIFSCCIVETNSDCLQKNGLLSQWRGYGKDGGYAIILDGDKLVEEFEKENEAFSYAAISRGTVTYDFNNLKSDQKTALDATVNNAFKVYRYERHRDPLSMIREDAKNLLNCSPFIKHNGFCEEREYRFYVLPFNEKGKEEFEKEEPLKNVKHRFVNGLIIPYVELFETSEKLPIKAICIGPHKDKILRTKSIQEFLEKKGLSYIKVFCAEIPFIG